MSSLTPRSVDSPESLEVLSSAIRDLEAMEWLQKMADFGMFSKARHNARRVQDIIARLKKERI